MTVSELVANLQRFPGDLPVRIYTMEGAVEDAGTVFASSEFDQETGKVREIVLVF